MIQVTGSIGSFTVSWDPVNVPDISGYILCGVPGAADFTPSGSNILNVGPETSFTYNTNYAGWFSVKVAAYDSFSDPKALILSDLNFSSLQTVEVLGLASEVLDKLNGQLTESQLHQNLASRINKIDAPATGLVDQLAQEILNRQSGDAEEAQARAAAFTDYYTKVETDSAISSAVVGATSGYVTDTSLATSLSSYYTKTEADSATATAITGATSNLVSNSSLATSLSSYYTKTQADSAIAQYVDYTSATIQGLVASSTIESSVRASTTGPDWDASTVYTKGAVVVYKDGATPFLFQRIDDSGALQAPSVSFGVPQTTAYWKPVSANLYAQTMLKTDVNGHITGIGLANDGVTGEVEILANKFKIVNPDLPTQSQQVFTVGTLNGTTGTVGVNGNMVLDGTLYARHIAANQLVVGDNVAMGANAYISWSNVQSKPTFSSVATSGSYADLSGQPTIPTNTNQLTDGAGLGQTAAWTGVSGRPNTTYIDANGIYTGQLTTNQLVAGTALIGSALIGDLAVTSAKIANTLQSTNYVANSAGWKIDKSGSIEVYNIKARGDVEASSLKADTVMVQTANVANQAITFPMSASRYTTQTVYIPRNLQSGAAPYFCTSSATVTMSLSGAPVMVLGVLKGTIGQGANAGAGFAGTDPIFEILRDSTVIYSGKAAVYGTDDTGAINAAFDMFRQTTDAPSPGSHTYSMRISTGIMLNQNGSVTGQCDFVEASLLVLETKR